MQSVNNDMDDLFRRAAENYPLHTKGADFNQVMHRLEAAGKERRQRTRNIAQYYSWVAAIFLLVICTTYIRKTEKIAIPVDEVAIGNSKSKDGSETIVPGKKDIREQKAGGTKVIKEGGSLVQDRKPVIAFIDQKKAKEGPFLIPSIGKTPTESANINTTEPENRLAVAVTERKVSRESEQPLLTPERMQLIARVLNENVKEPDGQTIASTGKERRTISSEIRGKLYAGLVAGPDMSTVRSQKLYDAGYSIGLIAGYQFNKRLSLETGVLWDRKEYYSSGRHFNKGALGLPAHANVIDVDGYCNMFEIPLNLRFNWAQKKGNNFFASAGVSSYLMKKEAYQYKYEYYGEQYDYYKQYNNASRNWASIMNLSIGFERKMGKAGALRIEPYVKLPLTGVGIGDMPISSKGVLIGFTRPIR